MSTPTIAFLKRVFDANGDQDAAKVRGGNWQDRTPRLPYGMACIQLAYPELLTLFVQEPTPVTEVGHGHYGVGSLRVDLWNVAHGDNAPSVLRDLIRAVTAPLEPA